MCAQLIIADSVSDTTFLNCQLFNSSLTFPNVSQYPHIFLKYLWHFYLINRQISHDM